MHITTELRGELHRVALSACELVLDDQLISGFVGQDH
jgi:hypothetical protein